MPEEEFVDAASRDPVDCIECGCSSGAAWRGWGGYRVVDPETHRPLEVVFYCPSCADREFGSGAEV